MDELMIGGRFNGPASSGNGGYTCGLVAARLPAPAGDQVTQVTLRVPPPLDTPLRATPADAGRIEVYAGDRLVAQTAPVRLDGDPVPPVSEPDAAGASTAYPGFADHPFPTCYVCGPRRPAGDGLEIFPGPLPDGRSAAPWRVPEDCSAVTVWAALDCPGGWAIISRDLDARNCGARELAPRARTAGRTYVLGQMAARVHAVPPPGSTCVVIGGVIGIEGRKAQVHTAVYAQARLLAWARSTWIAI